MPSSVVRPSTKVAPAGTTGRAVSSYDSSYGVHRINTQEFISEKQREKAYDIQFSLGTYFFELLCGITSLSFGIYLFLIPPCRGQSTVCVVPAMLVGVGSVIFFDAVRRIHANVRNGNLAIACGGPSKVSRDKLDNHVAMSIMESSFNDRNRKKGFTSAQSLNAVQDLVDTQVKNNDEKDNEHIMIGGKLRKRKKQRRCLLADARMKLLQDLFLYYSKGGSNGGDDGTPELCINCNGLVEVMLDTMTTGAESITLDESKKFMTRIDLDNDMLLQSNEFYNFLFNMWERDSPLFLNNVYATLGDMIYALHSKHIGKTSIAARTLLDVSKLNGEEVQILMVERMRDIYTWYDAGKTGAIDCNGLMKLVNDLVANKPEGELTLGEVKAFLEQVDDNGDMLLQSDELITYMQTSWLADAPLAQDYDDLNSFLNAVYPKYQNLLRKRWKEKNGFDADDLPTGTDANNTAAVNDMLDVGANDDKNGEERVPPPSGLPPVVKQKLRVLIETLWECYCSGSNAELDSHQLKCLLDDHIKSSEVPPDECMRFIQCMDLDKNESISKEEFESFVSQGLFMDDEQKKIYRTRSAMHIHLVEFLEIIEEQVSAQEISDDTSISFTGSGKKIENTKDENTTETGDKRVDDIDETIDQFQKEENAKENNQGSEKEVEK